MNVRKHWFNSKTSGIRIPYNSELSVAGNVHLGIGSIIDAKQLAHGRYAIFIAGDEKSATAIPIEVESTHQF